MKISGFTMGKNAGKLYYPMKESICSILPLVDEFIVALGDNDPDDNTREQILSIGSPKIKIIDTLWDIEKFPRGMEMAHQTDIAMSHCKGDWLFYMQADEVLHEKYLPVIEKRCLELLNDTEIEGLLFDYKHFWGDYDHYFNSLGWYPREIRIIRRDQDIHSWRDAQSFRRIPGFDGLSYRQEKNTYKLKVARVEACIFHYGWVRPPGILKSKIKEFRILQRGRSTVEAQAQANKNYYAFDYGPLNKVPRFKDTHPEVMKDWIAAFNWSELLQYAGSRDRNRVIHKHEKLKYRLKDFVEKNLLGGRSLGGFRNYELIHRPQNIAARALR